MKIIRLHIENFGKLSNIDMELQEGLNSVLENNGWGKSTLAAFIRVMFYGLEGERKKELSENDRTHYTPWNQGHFGGSLTFEANGKRYLVTRDLGKKDRAEGFLLRDADTLLESKDYSERLGEELFGIDRESFEKTSFIDHAFLRYRGINSAIGSKVGSVSQSDDLSNYDQAELWMKDYLNANSPKKKTGALYQQNDVIRGLEREVKNRGVVKDRIEGLKKQRDQEKESLKALDAQRARLRAELSGLSKMRAKVLDYKRLKELEKEAEGRERALREREESFGGRIPSREELKALAAKVEAAEQQGVRLESLAKQAESERLERLKRYFRKGVPEANEVQAQIGHCNALQDGLQKLAHLEEQESKEKQRLEGYALELQRLEVAAELAEAEKKKAEKNKLGGSIALLMIGVLLALLILIMQWNALLWIPAALLLLVGAGMLWHCLWKPEVKESVPSGKTELLRQQEETAAENLQGLKEERQRLRGSVQELEELIRSFLEEREISYSRADAENLLYEMKNRVVEYRELLSEQEEKTKAKEDAQKEAQRLEQELTASVRDGNPNLDPKDYAGIKGWITDSLQKLAAYEKELGERENSRRALAEFEKAHPDLRETGEGLLSEEEVNLEENRLNAGLKSLSGRESQLHETISAYNRNLEDAYAEEEELQEKQEQLEALKERQEQDAAKYELVKKTREYLKTAKEQFIARFMQPIQQAFDEYYALMTGREDAGEFQIDADLNVFRKEEGAYHGVEAQSEGYGDMIGLCIRMALLDAMYEKERPPVIMDDPFAGLDEDHLEGAKRFLEKISKKYQILYLTCHRIFLNS